MSDVAPICVGKTFPVGWMGGGWVGGVWMGGWMDGWVRNTENKAQRRLVAAGALSELGNISNNYQATKLNRPPT